MIARQPVLGFPTKTAAVKALRQKGLTTREIASAIGISTNAVTALEASARNPRSRASEAPTAAIRMAKLSDYFSLETIQALRPDAAKRGWSVDLLIKEIVTTIATSQLAAAVLDDTDEVKS